MKTLSHVIKKIYRRWLKKTTRVFYPIFMDEAKKMILSDTDKFHTDYRWEVETNEQLNQFRRWIAQDAAVLDFGIGIGRLSKEILREFSCVEVTGIDGSKKMLAYCKKYIPKEYRTRLHLFHFNESARIKDNSIDFAFSLHTLQHVVPSQFEKALKELYRAIKPGGLLYLFNTYQRCTFDNTKTVGYDDGIDQLKEISQYFEEKEDVLYTSSYMKEILKTHFSKLFLKK